jgi:hypothetical protein
MDPPGWLLNCPVDVPCSGKITGKIELDIKEGQNLSHAIVFRKRCGRASFFFVAAKAKSLTSARICAGDLCRLTIILQGV